MNIKQVIIGPKYTLPVIWKNILLKYFELAKKLNKKEWLQFFNFLLSVNDIKKEVFDIEIKKFKNTKDSDLLKLVNIIQNVN